MVDRRRAVILFLSLVGTFALVRTWLTAAPDADFTVGRYNIHHLFTGLVLVTAFGIPLALGAGRGRAGGVLTFGFGVGLALALDEWVYLIATDGSNASYLLPVSFWGGVAAVGLAAAYVLLLTAVAAGRVRRSRE